MPKAKSLFEQARQAKRRTTHYDIPLVDSEDAERLAADLAAAKRGDEQARLYGDDKLRREASQALSKAQAAYDTSHRRVVFKGLSAKDLDALANEHPEPDEDEEDKGQVPFIYHLAVACCDEDVTAEQWQKLCEEVWGLADAREFRDAVQNANFQPFSAGIPKG
jgi:hypothetical protein